MYRRHWQGAFQRAKREDFITLDDINAVAPVFTAQGMAHSERPHVRDIVDVSVLKNNAERKFVANAVAEEKMETRPNRRAAMELFGVLAPAMIALIMAMQIGFFTGLVRRHTFFEI